MTTARANESLESARIGASQLPAPDSGAPVWEQRWHPLREEWVIIAAHRQHRPWIGETAPGAAPDAPDYMADCFLCPGNRRVAGERNPVYTQTFAFDNDHPCVGPSAPEPVAAPAGPMRSRRAGGAARVVCYSPLHNQTLAELTERQIAELLSVLQREFIELSARPGVNHVLIFENKGEAVGVSNPHPHCQIYATNFVFKYIETEVAASRAYFSDVGRSLLGDIIESEIADGRRMLFLSKGAVAFVPYFARYAYEAYVAPRKTYPDLGHMPSADIWDVAGALKAVLVMFDNLWRMPFPYVMAFHQAPTDSDEHPGFHFHIEFHPPLRKPNLLKYLAGPEIGGGSFVSDTAPEEKAAELRAVSGEHYTQLRRKALAP